MILALGLRVARAILSHSGCRPSATWRLPNRRVALSRIGAAGDVPIAHRLTVRGKAEHGFERDVPVKAAIVAKDEFVEICVDVLAAKAMIRAQSPSLHQREDPMNPRQHDVARHLADGARIVPVIVGQSGIGCVAVCEQRSSALHIGLDEGFD